MRRKIINIKWIISIISVASLLGASTFFIFIYYGWFFAFELLTESYDVTVEVPGEDSGENSHVYLIPKKINNVFLFNDATKGKFFYSQERTAKNSFSRIDPFYLLLVNEQGEGGRRSCYKFVLGNNGFTLEKIRGSGYSRSYFIRYHILKAFIIIIILSIVSFWIVRFISNLEVRFISGDKRVAWILAISCCCYLILLFGFIFY